MATAIEARTQVSRDLGDFFDGTTTSSGSTTQFNDTKLANYDDDIFVTKFNTWALAVDGTNAGEFRRVTSKSGTAVTTVAFSNTMASGVKYEIHRVADPDEKDAAVTHTINLLQGVVLWKRAHKDITIVADQFDYDVPSGFYRDQIRQIHHVSAGDDEITREIFDWEPRVDSGGANDIHLFSRLEAGEKIRVFGHQVVALSDMTDGDGFMLIMSARAAMYILKNVIAQAPNEQIQRWQTLLTTNTVEYTERLARFTDIGIPFTQRLSGMRSGGLDRDFGTP